MKSNIVSKRWFVLQDCCHAQLTFISALLPDSSMNSNKFVLQVTLIYFASHKTVLDLERINKEYFKSVQVMFKAES